MQDTEEAEYWAAVSERGRTEELNEAVLGRLREGGQERLLAIGQRFLSLPLDRLRDLARQRLPGLSLDPAEQEEAWDHPVLLPELAFEQQGDHASAAALYALTHDAFCPDRDPAAGFVRACLRFKLGHCLHMLDESPESARRCIALVQPALTLLERASEQEAVPLANQRLLRFHVHEFLGCRFNNLGDHAAAHEAFEGAARNADDVELQVANGCMAAAALIDLGERQRAYQRLMEERPRLAEIEDPETIEQWEFLYASLRSELGGREVFAERGLSSRSARLVGSVQARWLHREEPPEAHTLEELQDQLQDWAGTLQAEDARGRFGLLLARLRLLSPFEEPQRWREVMREAEALEEHFPDERPKLERRILLARGWSVTGQSAAALELFAASWPRAAALLPLDQQLSTAGFYLEALTKSYSPANSPTLLELTDFLTATLETLIVRQPGAAARKRVREVHQRAVEAAFAALLTAADSSGLASAAGQALLARAWALIMACRNPELRASPAEPPAELLARRRELEDAFHRQLRERLVGAGKGQGWKDELAALLDFELAWLEVTARLDEAAHEPPATETSLAFFQIRELVQSRPWLVLAHAADRFEVRQVSRGQEAVVEPLQLWLADVKTAGVPPGEAQERALPVALELLSFLSTRQPEEPVHLFPDGTLYGIPLEALPDPQRPDRCLGQQRPVQMSLRPAAARLTRPVDLSRGWLGVGGVPAAGPAAPFLSESRTEIRRIQSDLTGLGFPATTLQGRRARASLLRDRLAALRPAVLHLAVHGVADVQDPDACTLILAPDPGAPEGELLPYRRLRELPLDGVELVVLSACSSLIGRAGRSSGMEGLAWGFLEAGVALVLASRYAVDDAATAGLMTALYRHLPEHSPAEALRRARDERLRAGTNLYEVGAWALWG